MLTKLTQLSRFYAAAMIIVIGCAVYAVGLTNPFQGDDYDQIVNNVPVHSLTHIKILFEGSTFYAGQGLAPLEGSYYRPLMSTIFSVIYSLFGAHPFYYHLVQLALYLSSAIIFYLFLRYSFKPGLALALSLIFLVHPMNAQVVFAIPSMQDALFFFFGMSALYLLLRYKTTKSLPYVIICLGLSLLSKESAILFVVMALLYLFWWDRKRLLPFIGGLLVIFLIYIPLRIHAVGLLTNPYGGPIDSYSLIRRLNTMPSIFLFYFSHFLWPGKLASGYYWTYPYFSVRHVVLPLVLDLMIIASIIYLGTLLHKQASKSMFYTYVFFAVWSGIGLLLLIQIIPLDLTAGDFWFYFPMAGILGMAGVLLSVFPIHMRTEWLVIGVMVLIVVLGVRTFMRGLDYRSPYKLMMTDIADSQDNYRADKTVASDLINQGRYTQAQSYEMQAMRIFPQYPDFINMAAILTSEGHYSDAMQMYQRSVPFAGPGTIHETYDGEAALTLLTGKEPTNKAFLLKALHAFPQDAQLWMFLALLDERNNDNGDARVAIQNAEQYGQIPPSIYDDIIKDDSFSVTIAGQTIPIR